MHTAFEAPAGRTLSSSKTTVPRVSTTTTSSSCGNRVKPINSFYKWDSILKYSVTDFKCFINKIYFQPKISILRYRFLLRKARHSAEPHDSTMHGTCSAHTFLYASRVAFHVELWVIGKEGLSPSVVVVVGVVIRRTTSIGLWTSRGL